MSRALNEVREEAHPRQSRCTCKGPGAETRLEQDACGANNRK